MAPTRVEQTAQVPTVAFLGSHPQSFRCLAHLVRHHREAEVVAVVPNRLPTAARADQDVTVLAERHGLPVRAHADLLDLEFDLGIMLLYDTILSPALVRAPRLGFVNFHLAPVPMFRGVNGVLHALRLARSEGLTSYAITLHYVDDGLDTGPVIATHTVPMFDDDTAASLHARACEAVYTLFAAWIGALLAAPRRVPAEPQPREGRTFRRADTVHEVDLSGDPDVVYDQIRALSFPGKPRPYARIGPYRVFLTLDEI